MKREEYQVSIFKSFVRAAQLNADLTTLELQDEPDIRCRVEGKLCGYELTAATDGALEEEARKNPGAARWFGTSVPCAAFVKLWRKYRYDIPVELVVHEATAPLFPLGVWEEELIQMLRVHFEGSGFRRVWVVNPWKPEILFRWPL